MLFVCYLCVLSLGLSHVDVLSSAFGYSYLLTYLPTYLLTYLLTSGVRQVAFSPRLCSAVRLIGSWNALSLPSASHWAVNISRIWIMHITSAFWLTPYIRPSYRSGHFLDNSVKTLFTKFQNLCADDYITYLTHQSVNGHSVEEVTEFRYLGSVLSTTGRCHCQPDTDFRPIGIASSAMFSMESLATDPSSTADETPLIILDLHTAYSPDRFGSLDRRSCRKIYGSLRPSICDGSV